MKRNNIIYKYLLSYSVVYDKFAVSSKKVDILLMFKTIFLASVKNESLKLIYSIREFLYTLNFKSRE